MSCLPFCIPAAELMCIAGCSHWIGKRCMLHGSMASEDWPEATYAELKDVPRACRLILGVYEEDVSKPQYADRLVPEQVVRKTTYDKNDGKCPPYLIYVDHEAKDVALAIRGLHLGQKPDYELLLDNRKGQQMFDGGYVHHGLLKVAGWLLQKEFDTLKSLLLKYEGYTLTLMGHSLGSGIATIMTIILVNSRKQLAPVSRKRIRCIAIAPARSVSMNLAIRYADCIKSVILQDDFLPRTSAPLQLIFASMFCLPCLLALSCVRDTFIPRKRMLSDPRRLYAPGRLYHMVYTEFGSCKRLPAMVRTSIPVEGRFEHIVCSRNATEDHSLVHIERKVTEALELLEQSEGLHEIPVSGRLARAKTLERDQKVEYDQALHRAVSLGVYNAQEPDEVLKERADSTMQLDRGSEGAQDSLYEVPDSAGESGSWRSKSGDTEEIASGRDMEGYNGGTCVALGHQHFDFGDVSKYGTADDRNLLEDRHSSQSSNAAIDGSHDSVNLQDGEDYRANSQKNNESNSWKQFDYDATDASSEKRKMAAKYEAKEEKRVEEEKQKLDTAWSLPKTERWDELISLLVKRNFDKEKKVPTIGRQNKVVPSEEE